MSAVKPHLAVGRLHIVPGMPQFSYPIYSVQSATADEGVIRPALAGLRAVSKAAVKPKNVVTSDRRSRLKARSTRR